jgi:hypothetical protein
MNTGLYYPLPISTSSLLDEQQISAHQTYYPEIINSTDGFNFVQNVPNALFSGPAEPPFASHTALATTSLEAQHIQHCLQRVEHYYGQNLRGYFLVEEQSPYAELGASSHSIAGPYPPSYQYGCLQ